MGALVAPLLIGHFSINHKLARVDIPRHQVVLFH
jgi:hypothetical protein